MGYAEKRKGGYRARYRDLAEKWPTIVDAYGHAVIYGTKRGDGGS